MRGKSATKKENGRGGASGHDSGIAPEKMSLLFSGNEKTVGDPLTRPIDMECELLPRVQATEPTILLVSTGPSRPH